MEQEKKTAVELVVKYCTDNLDLNQQLPDEYYYSSLPLCVIDSVFSINARYRSVKNTVRRFCEHYNKYRRSGFPVKESRDERRAMFPPIEEQISVTTVLEHLMDYEGKPELANIVFGNRQRTSPRSGILKAEAVIRFLKILKEYGVDYFQDMEKITGNEEEDFENRIRKIPGHASGISLLYFFMLCGDDNYIRPDRMIVGFFQNACWPTFHPNNVECREILSEVTEELNGKGCHLTPRLLDNIIWKFQGSSNNNRETAKKKTVKRKKVLYIDMDNVLVDFKSALDRQPEKTLQEYKGREDEIPHLFGQMLPMPGAIGSFKMLAEEYDTYILSTAPWENPSAWSEKLEWVKRYLGIPAYKRLIISHHKDLNRGGYLIDDRTKNGAGKFAGELILFGSRKFPDWRAVCGYLLKDWRAGKIASLLFGIAVGDALGVPVEFKSRESLKNRPVVDMMGFGTHSQPPGTWSDDSSLTFCLAEALTGGFDLNRIGKNFVKWLDEGYWTARGSVFDIGIATRRALERIRQGVRPELAGGSGEDDNGNGSLMRIAPLLFYLSDKPVNKRYEITRQVSSVTHGHIRSVIACFYYLEFARLLLEGRDRMETYRRLQTEIPACLHSLPVEKKETELFDRLLKGNIYELPEEEISSSGYVLHTLEAAVWCLLTTGSYRDAVLKAVNLGEDTDTTAAVTGGLAGLLYGLENIPSGWREQIAKREAVAELAERLANIGGGGSS
ncbi:MAG: ADP-ribosylglycohydrolase family protein [Tannerella sp.]|jgi:ADP-ribosylglycohydrolase/5'(3')-deoxyribonucleotidase|nr:ADP-ribosylglycohydrolase family protein [Tannerella sp.]